MPEITDAAINAYAAKVIRDQATGLDYLDLAEHMFDDTTIGDVRLAELDGPDIDDVQRRVLDQVHSARIAVGWPAIDNFIGMPGGRLQDWTNAIRQVPADQHIPMPLHILGDLVAVLAEYGTLVDHFVECPTLAGNDPYALAACRACGCTDHAACDGGCSWVEDPWQGGHLCSACLPPDPASVPPLPDEADEAKAREFLADLRGDIESYHERIPGTAGCSCGKMLGCNGGAAELEPVGILQDILRWVGAARTAATADPDDFEIAALHDCDIRETWVHVTHTPCQETVFGGPDDYEDLDAGELLKRMAAHRCEPGAEAEAEPRDVSQIIDVDVDGSTVTAAIHGSRPLDAEEQAAMADVVRAASRLDREKQREKRRQADEDVRAVAAALEAIAGFWTYEAPDSVLAGAHADLQQRFADRIAEVQWRDAEQADQKRAAPDGGGQP